MASGNGVRAALAVGALLLAGPGCHQRTYSTTGIYEAIAGGYRATVTSSGSFSTQHDLNPVPTGTATITPVGGGGQPTVVLTMPGNETVRYTVGNAPAVVAPWGGPHTETTLKAILTAAGYTALPDAEIDAMAWAIEGVTLGPKGTMSPGPGAVLRIVQVTIR